MRMRRTCRWLSISVLSVLALAGSLHAQEKTDDAARILFDAGAKAYAAGLYADAVTAFREAHTLAPDRPTVLFSLAQAERRQYTVNKDPAMVEAAIAHFRKYLELVTEGGRRGDAVIALGELEALRVGAEAPTVKAPRIFITTETPGATIYVDGQKRNQVPVIEEAAPGKHIIKIEAPGFVEETREIVALEGAIFPLEMNLREKPSLLSIKAPAGASISVDGRVYGDASLHTDLELASGQHRILVTQRGYVPYDKLISLERAGSSSLNVSMKPTAQRRASYLLFGASMVGFGIGAGLIVATIVKDSEASTIYERAKKENIDRSMLERYLDARSTRDILLGSTSAIESLAFGLGIASAATYFFDSSSRSNPPGGRNEARISVAPLAGGGFMSVNVQF